MKISRNQIGAVVLGWLGVMALSGRADVLFSQDFSSSTNWTDYYNSSPTKNQFSILNGTSSTISIENGQLKYVKTAGGGANVQRWVAMEGTPVTSMVLSYDLNVQFSSLASGTRLITAQIGEPVSGGSAMAWGIDSTGTANQWKITGTTATFTGVQTVKIFINNTGASLDYTDPSGGTQALATGYYDIWVGSTLAADGKTLTSTINELTTFNLSMPTATAATYYYDNFEVTAIPEPATISLFSVSCCAGALIRRCLR